MKFLFENKLEIILITTIVFLTFCQAFFNFFRADDWTWLYVAHISQKDITQIFTLQLAGFFRPFNHLLFLVWYSLFGLNPIGYNVVNIMLHLTNSLLVYMIALKFARNKSVSLIAGLVFAVLSAHFESLLFISGGMSDNSLMAFFFMTSFLFFIRWSETKSKKYLALSLLTFVLNLLSYEGSVMFVPLLLFYLIVFDKKFRLRSLTAHIKNLLPYAVVLIPYIFYQYAIQVSGTVIKLGLFSIGWHFARNLLDYTVSIFTLFPLISIEYLSRLNVPQLVYLVVNDFILLTSIIVGLVGLYIIFRGDKTTRFFLGWYLIIFIPFLFFTSPITSRYTYTPSIGVAILIGILCVDAHRRLSKIFSPKIAKVLVLVVVGLFVLANIIEINLIESFKYKINDDQKMVDFLQSNYKTFPEGSKIYFVNGMMPFKSPVLQMTMSLLYPHGNQVDHLIYADKTTYDVYYSNNFQIYEISRSQVENVTKGQNIYIFDYVKTDYRNGIPLQLSP